MCLGDGVERQRSDAADLIEEGVSRLNTCVYKNWREKFVYTKNGKKHFVFNTPPGAKWASAEAQFIPNFSLHTRGLSRQFFVQISAQILSQILNV